MRLDMDPITKGTNSTVAVSLAPTFFGGPGPFRSRVMRLRNSVRFRCHSRHPGARCARVKKLRSLDRNTPRYLKADTDRPGRALNIDCQTVQYDSRIGSQRGDSPGGCWHLQLLLCASVQPVVRHSILWHRTLITTGQGHVDKGNRLGSVEQTRQSRQARFDTGRGRSR